MDEHLQRLLDKKTFAHLATVMADGSPQVSPVWVDRDGDVVLVNTVADRVKDRNMRRNPAVALSLVDPDDAYKYVLVKGRVVAITEQGADAHIDRLANKYLGQPKYGFRQPGERRVIFRIAPQTVTGNAGGG